MKKTILGMMLIASTIMVTSCKKSENTPVTKEIYSTTVGVDSGQVQNY